MIIAPDHIKKFCRFIKNTNLLSNFNNKVNSFVYQICCDCGCEYFEVFTNDTPKVIAYCSECRKKIIVYDLMLYPASKPTLGWIPVWLEDEDDLKPLDNYGYINLFVNYQYGESYTDSEFDSNDITGFNMWIYDNGMMTLIIDDETA